MTEIQMLKTCVLDFGDSYFEFVSDVVLRASYFFFVGHWLLGFGIFIPNPVLQSPHNHGILSCILYTTYEIHAYYLISKKSPPRGKAPQGV